MHNFRQLRVWQKAMELCELIYRLTAAFPDTEKFGLISQIRRCAVSIPSNIAEGCGRNSDIEFARFLSVALGSCYELSTQLILANRLDYLPDEGLEQST